MDKVLIGTPIRDTKEYSTYLWLDSVFQLDYPNFDLLIVDNSDTPFFSERVRAYCDKNGFKNYEIVRLAFGSNDHFELRLGKSREVIRNKVLGEYDYWLSWECDILLPPNALKILLSKIYDFDGIQHSYPDRTTPNMEMVSMGVSLYKKEVLEKISFVNFGTHGEIDKSSPNCYYGNDGWFARQVFLEGKSVMTVSNLIKGIKHLDN